MATVPLSPSTAPRGASIGSSDGHDSDADEKRGTGWGSSTAFFFAYDVVVIIVLLAIALASSAHAPDWEGLRMHWPVLSFDRVLPLWVPWAGALGGATISLVGVAEHADDWMHKLRWWHVSRPLLGAVAGTFSVLVLVFVLQSIVPEVSGRSYSAKGTAVLTGIAFVVGYREETFRALMKRVADVILKPGDTTPETPADHESGTPGRPEASAPATTPATHPPAAPTTPPAAPTTPPAARPSPVRWETGPFA